MGPFHHSDVCDKQLLAWGACLTVEVCRCNHTHHRKSLRGIGTFITCVTRACADVLLDIVIEVQRGIRSGQVRSFPGCRAATAGRHRLRADKSAQTPAFLSTTTATFVGRFVRGIPAQCISHTQTSKYCSPAAVRLVIESCTCFAAGRSVGPGSGGRADGRFHRTRQHLGEPLRVYIRVMLCQTSCQDTRRDFRQPRMSSGARRSAGVLDSVAQRNPPWLLWFRFTGLHISGCFDSCNASVCWQANPRRSQPDAFGQTVPTVATAPIVCTNCGKRMAAGR